MKGYRYPRLKEGGWKSRVEKWAEVNWSNTDTAIARFMGVDRKAVSWQCQRRGIPASTARGGDTTTLSPYLP